MSQLVVFYVDISATHENVCNYNKLMKFVILKFSTKYVNDEIFSKINVSQIDSPPGH